jgi:preflagellin peptidase FlaK
VLLAALTAIILFLYNAFWHLKTRRELFGHRYENATLGRRILILVTAYRVSISKLKEKWHVYPLEDIAKNAQNQFTRKLLVIPRDEGRNAIVERLEKAVSDGTIQDSVWATPGLPFLIFLAFGLLAALFVGDIVWILLGFVL